MKIRKGDIVKIISGNDKGKQGKVISVIPQEFKIVVEGINIRKKHVRSRRQGQKGERVRIPAAFPASRAMPVCSKCSKPVGVVYRTDEGEKKMRACKKCGAEM